MMKRLTCTMWFGLFCLVVAVMVVSGIPILASVQVEEGVRVGSRAEWDPARVVLMHTPGEEVFQGVIHPDAALYEQPFSLHQARLEHLNYIDVLEREGVTVYTVVDVLLQGTVDDEDQTMPGPELDALRELAGQYLIYDVTKLEEGRALYQEKYKEEVLRALGPHELVQIILLQPTVMLEFTDINTGYTAEYRQEPVMNLYFCRDQVITTARGVVIGRMNSPQRFVETEIIQFVLGKLGIEPVYQVTGDGRLEGGDYFSAGDIAFIGQGLRTNAEGISQLLDNQVFGLPRVAVVKDSWHNQEQMHLDTYFNLINPGLAVLVDMRMDLPSQPRVEDISTLVDLYELVDGSYVKTLEDRDFQAFLEQDLGYTVIPISRQDQNRYGVNFLTVRTDRVLAIDGVSDAYRELIAAHGVDATWMDFSVLTSGYGAAHCTTQVLWREDAQ